MRMNSLPLRGIYDIEGQHIVAIHACRCRRLYAPICSAATSVSRVRVGVGIALSLLPLSFEFRRYPFVRWQTEDQVGQSISQSVNQMIDGSSRTAQRSTPIKQQRRYVGAMMMEIVTQRSHLRPLARLPTELIRLALNEPIA